MKKHLLVLTAAAVLFFISGCESSYTDKMTGNYPADYDLVYGLRQVLQYDPANINGINVGSKFDFFSTLRFTIHHVDSKVAAVTFANNNVPFSPFGFVPPGGRTEAYLDKSVLPNVLRIKSTGDAIATFTYGEYTITFQLDSPLLSYKYTFKSVQ